MRSFLQKRFFLKRAPKAGSGRKKVLLVIALVIGVPALVLFVIGGAVLLWFMKDLPSIDRLKEPFALSTIIYDSQGNELYKIHGEENRKYVPLDQINPLATNATLAIEDRNFYTRPFLDFKRVLRAAMNNAVTGERQGASTITQQLIKNILLTKDQTYERKVKEAILAYQVESRFSKKEILEMYMNQVPYGSNAYGVEQAAKTFLNKTAKDMTVLDAAILASLPNAPTYFSPFGPNRHRLMGYCKTNETNLEESTDVKEAETAMVLTDEKVDLSALSMKIVATTPVWISVKMDGGKKEQMTLKAGEEKTFSAKERFDINLGNPSPSIYINTLAVKVPKSLYLAVEQEKLKDVLQNPEELDELKSFIEKKDDQEIVQGKCKSMDDEQWIKGRKDLVLDRMVEDKYITKEERDQAWKEGLSFQFHKYKQEITHPHFVFYVKNYLEERYGQDIETSGWKVYTSIDPKLQAEAEEIVKRNVEINEKRFDASNAALVSINSETGHIVAMVGSRDYWNEEYDGNVNITTRKLQPGSSFKPFVYAALFEGPYGTGTALWDVKTGFGPIYPDNYDKKFPGPMTVRKALANSRNIPAIKAYFLAGEEDKILEFVAKLGITSLKDYKESYNKGKPAEEQFHYGWPMAIGSGEVTPLEMASAYSVFANNGMKKEITPILEIRDKDGNIVEKWEPGAHEKQVIDPQVAYQISDILSDENARPGGYWREKLSIPGQIVATKTGTSNKRYPNGTILPNNVWTVGYSRYLTTAVWAGNTSGEAMNSQGEGLSTAAPIFKEYMIKAHEGKEKKEFERPAEIKTVTVSTLSGNLASASTPKGYTSTEIFANWAVPLKVDDSVENVKVDLRNGYLANALCPTDAIKEVLRFNVHSERPENPAWEKPVLEWAARNIGLAVKEGEENATVVMNEESPLCKEFTDAEKPKITIVSPNSFGFVSKGKVNVKVNIDAPFGIQYVEYAVNGMFQYKADEGPFDIGYVNIQDSFSEEDTHTISVRLVDKNYLSATSEVKVKIAEDKSKPNISVKNPGAGENIPLGSTVQVEVDAYDEYSSIGRVEVFMDGSAITTLRAIPYKFSFYADPKKYNAGNHTFRFVAHDNNKNSEETTVTVKFVEGSGTTAETVKDATLQAYITEPGSGSSFSAGKGIVRVGVQVSEAAGDGTYTIELLAQEAGKGAQAIDSFSAGAESAGTSHFLYWNGLRPGTYDLFLKIQGGGQVRYSPKKQVTITE